jgi:site-specific DNA recombinase
VWSEVRKLLRDPSRLSSELERRRKASPETMPDLAESERRLKILRGRLDRLIDAYTSDLLERSEFESRIVPLRDQHDREAAAVASLRGATNESDTTTALTTLAHLSEAVTARLDTATAAFQRELIELLVKRIEVTQKEVRIVYKVPSPPFPNSPASPNLNRLCCPKSRLETLCTVFE